MAVNMSKRPASDFAEWAKLLRDSTRMPQLELRPSPVVGSTPLVPAGTYRAYLAREYGLHSIQW